MTVPHASNFIFLQHNSKNTNYQVQKITVKVVISAIMNICHIRPFFHSFFCNEPYV